MNEDLMISEEDVAGIKDLYQKAISGRDEAAIQLLAEEAVRAEMLGVVVAEAMAALEMGRAEALDVLASFESVVAESAEPLSLLGLKD